MAACRGSGGGDTERSVRLGVDAAGEELALDMRVPVVLDLVVRSTRQPPGDQRPPVSWLFHRKNEVNNKEQNIYTSSMSR
jgi:hypothetical protein